MHKRSKYINRKHNLKLKIYNDYDFQLAELLLDDKEDLIHKANGWALRFAGDKDREQLLRFLDKHAVSMPRVTLRYATEHFEKKHRDKYLNMKKERSA
jgi:3-methyladenine DNA glycosylase AlkD